MDIFVSPVAGNIAGNDEIGSIECGLGNVNTPLLVVLGHSQCGAVTAAAKAAQGEKGHDLEKHIGLPLSHIAPAAKRTVEAFPYLRGGEVIPLAIVENIWQTIEELLTKSVAVRDLVKKGTVKIVGGVYDVGSGDVTWLDTAKVNEILKKADAAAGKAPELSQETAH